MFVCAIIRTSRVWWIKLVCLFLKTLSEWSYGVGASLVGKGRGASQSKRSTVAGSTEGEITSSGVKVSE